MKLHHVSHPLTEEERFCIEQIEALRRAYQEQAQPYIDRMTAIAACRAPRFWIELEPGEEAKAKRLLQ